MGKGTRGSGQDKTSEAWFKRGFLLKSSDTHRNLNEGLSARERRALDKENTRPWGMSIWSTKAVTKRADTASKGRKAVSKSQARGKENAKKNGGWFS